MLFSSITFLYYFLPWTLIIYFIVPQKVKNIVLLISSLFFYAWGEPKIVLCMIATILMSYVLGILMENDSKHKKVYLILSVILCLGSLGYFKYADFFIENFNKITGFTLTLLNVSLPIGISFYTFQVLSYNIDVYCGKVSAQKNLLYLATYITMFPQLVAGPIVRYQNVEMQLAKRDHTPQNIADGIRRFVTGLAKKVLIANVLGELCLLFNQSNEKSVLFCWMYAAAFSLQIYFDFSGYSDMAIGLGKILGFEFMENFNYPYISKSITEFWRRWHISLGSWFRDYVYIPLGGSRVKTGRMYFNIFIVWMLTGLWHGAAWNFVVWGLFFAVLLILEKKYWLKYLEKERIFSHLYVIICVMISFVIFNAETLRQAFVVIGGMIGVGNIPMISAEAVYYLKSYAFVYVVALFGATPIYKTLIIKIENKLNTNKHTKMFANAALYLEPVVWIASLVMVTAYLIDGSFNPFLYFRF